MVMQTTMAFATSMKLTDVQMHLLVTTTSTQQMTMVLVNPWMLWAFVAVLVQLMLTEMGFATMRTIVPILLHVTTTTPPTKHAKALLAQDAPLCRPATMMLRPQSASPFVSMLQDAILALGQQMVQALW
jgi:hypothetical protein